MRTSFIAIALITIAACMPASNGGSSASSTSSASSSSAVPSINTTGLPLMIPDAFGMEIFAKDLPGARAIAQDGMGNYWVSQTSEGVVTLLEIGDDGTVVSQNAIFRNLKKPHGLAVDPGPGMTLYIAEEHQISRVGLYADGPLEKIYDLPAGGRHFTRTLEFGPDGKLYVSIGSTCDVCREKDERIASIISMNPDGSDVKIIAKGLRNTVFFTWSYVDGRMWATEMGRDKIGDDVPPDELNVIEEAAPPKDYGWPYCYGKQIRDTAFEPATTFDCTKTEPSTIDLQAHVAPLGIVFVPEEGWPEEFWYDALVAMHGSWNRSVPVGYQVARVPLDAQGRLEGPITPLVSGWLDDGSALGRPVGMLIRPGGLLLITDDKAGVVYRLHTLVPQQ